MRGWLTAYMSDKTAVKANAHSAHLADHLPEVLVCQKKKRKSSVSLRFTQTRNNEQKKKNKNKRKFGLWERSSSENLKWKENKEWARFHLGHTLTALLPHLIIHHITSGVCPQESELNLKCQETAATHSFHEAVSNKKKKKRHRKPGCMLGACPSWGPINRLLYGSQYAGWA